MRRNLKCVGGTPKGVNHDQKELFDLNGQANLSEYRIDLKHLGTLIRYHNDSKMGYNVLNMIRGETRTMLMFSNKNVLFQSYG